MSSLTIQIPNNGIPNYWFKLINKYLSTDYSKIETVIVDFNTTNYLETDDIVLLACLFDLIYDKGIKISFMNGGPLLKRYLSGIKFKKYWTEGFDRDKFTVTHNKNTLCLWHISPAMISDYSQFAKKFYETTFFNGKDLLPLISNMSEIFNNIFDHSFSDVNGYIITQYSKKPKRISFSVCDFGIGIANSLNNYYEKNDIQKVSDSQAIRNSLEMGVSAFTTSKNKGFGLSNVLDFTQNFNGELSIYANSGHLYKKFDEDFLLMETGYNFPGTLVKVEVSSLEFDKIDTENEIFEL